MDNKKSYAPRTLEKAKAFEGTERLPSKITGVLAYSGWYKEKRKIWFYINHDQVMSLSLSIDYFHTLV